MRVRTFLTCVGVFLLAGFIIPWLPFRVEAQPSHGGTITRVRPVVDGNIAVYDGITGFFIGDSGVSAASISTNSCSLPTNAVTGDMVRYDGTNWLATSGFVAIQTTSTWDFTAITFDTANNSYISFDVSTNENGETLVPAGAKSVAMRSNFIDDDLNALLIFASPSTNVGHINSLTVAGVGQHKMSTCPIDNQTLLYYKSENSTNSSYSNLKIYGAWY